VAHKANIQVVAKLPQFDYMPFRAYNKLLPRQYIWGK
jgi:hypothetical protein